MMDASMNDLDINQKLDFDTDIKPLVEEKQQNRLSKVRLLEEELEELHT